MHANPRHLTAERPRIEIARLFVRGATAQLPVPPLRADHSNRSRGSIERAHESVQRFNGPPLCSGLARTSLLDPCNASTRRSGDAHAPFICALRRCNTVVPRATVPALPSRSRSLQASRSLEGSVRSRWACCSLNHVEVIAFRAISSVFLQARASRWAGAAQALCVIATITPRTPCGTPTSSYHRLRLDERYHGSVEVVEKGSLASHRDLKK